MKLSRPAHQRPRVISTRSQHKTKRQHVRVGNIVGAIAVACALASAGVPAGPINDVADVFADPQVVARAMRIDPGGVPGVASPIVIDGKRQVSDRPSPRLGSADEPGAGS